MTNPLADRINQRLTELRLTVNAASAKAGGSPSLIANILNGRSKHPRSDTLQKIADVLETTPEWLLSGKDPALGTNRDEIELAEHVLAPRPDLAPMDIPVMGTAAGSILETGNGFGAEGFEIGSQPIQYVRRPLALTGQKDIYAIFVRGDSMDPMHPPGDIRFVSPNRPCAPGDTVIVQTQHWDGDPGQAYIKIYRRRTGDQIILEQLNPPLTFNVPVKNVIAIHRVVSNNELFGV